MVNIGNYNPDEHNPNQAFDPLPVGWYGMQIIASEVKGAAKNPQNKYLKLTFEILEERNPEFKGRQAWVNLNLWNTNSQSVDIANRDLSAICKAIGHLGELGDSDTLHHRPMAVKLGIDPGDAQYEPSNKIKAYDSMASRFDGAVTQAPAQAPAQATLATT